MADKQMRSEIIRAVMDDGLPVPRFTKAWNGRNDIYFQINTKSEHEVKELINKIEKMLKRLGYELGGSGYQGERVRTGEWKYVSIHTRFYNKYSNI